MAKDFDVIHLHSVFLFPTWIGARTAARAGVPYVLSPRGMLDRVLIDRRSRAIKRTWIRMVERRNLAGAVAIHLTSHQERRALSDLGLVLAPSVVIPNGVDAPARFQSDAVSADVRELITGGFEILSLGRISWKKALDRLILAMPHLPNAKVVIVGDVENGEAARLRGIAQVRGVADRVRFLPRHVDGPDKEALFAGARVFVLPSVSENFGNVVVEAMVRGLPVIVTSQVGAAELVKASGGGVIVEGNPVSLGNALFGLLGSSIQMSEMGAAGASYARAHLAWSNIGRQFTELYRTIAQGQAFKAEARSPAAQRRRLS
jgi:glycosyltransferase involved in cell wall biosynthesis